MVDRMSGHARLSVVVLVAAVVAIVGVSPAVAVLCTGPEGFGSCHRALRPHVGEFPFGITVAESANQIVVVDLFDGLAYKYLRSDLQADPIVFSGPLPSPVTYSGIAYRPGNLYWVASSDGGATYELVQSDLNGGLIDQFPLESPAGGFIGDISFDDETETFWGCDLENDIYFEFNPNGTLTGVEFLSPTIAYGAESFGTGITVATLAGTKVLDIPVGSATDLKPSQVRRFDTNGSEIGQVYNLNLATSPGQQWITGIAFSPSGSQPTPTEYIVDAVGNFLYEVPVLEQTLENVTHLTCTVDSSNSVALSWINQLTYAGIRVLRDGMVLDTLTVGDDSYVDSTADEGTHTYTIQVMQTSMSPWTDSMSCDAVTGPGRLITAVLHEGSNAFGITVDEGNDEVYVLDLDGTLHRYTRTLDYVATESSFAAGSVLTGIAMRDGDIYMVDVTLSQLIRASSPTSGSFEAIESFPLSSPQGGAIGGIDFDVTTDTFWGVDVTEDVYFEFNIDGSLTGNTFEFGEGLGNGVASVADSGFFDVTNGSPGSAIVDRVVRLDSAGTEQGFEFGVEPTTQSGFINGIVHTNNGIDGEPGEYLVGNDTNTIYGVTLLSQGAPFIRGDANGDGSINLIDPTYHLQILFGPTAPEFTCADALDADDNGSFTGGDGLSDVMYTLGYLFSGGPPPPAPFPTCEVDPTEDVNSCESHGGC